MIGHRVTVLEDDAALRSVLEQGLREERYRVTVYRTGTELINGADPQDPPDVFVIDIGLPDADGRDVVQALRASGIGSPVIFLTARDALSDRLSGFAAGGDDYLTKPFAFAELAARVAALVRRNGTGQPDSDSGLRLDPATHAASFDGAPIEMTPTEFRLLARLAAEPGQVVRRRDLVRAAWPHGAIVHDNTLDVYIVRLRRKLGQCGEAPRITTARGVGYALR